jgi:hypothetical protein
MLPTFLVKERVVHSDGSGPVTELGSGAGKLIVLTLGITRSVEHQGLEVVIQGSADGEYWRTLVKYPQKFYCGLYSTLLNLSTNEDVSYLRVQWRVNRLARNEATPLFGFYLYMEQSGARIAGAGRLGIVPMPATAAVA